MSAFEEWQRLSSREQEQAISDAKKGRRSKKTKLILSALAGGPFAIAGLLGSTGKSFNGKYTPYQQYNLDKSDKPLSRDKVQSMKRKQPKYSEAAAITGLTAATLVGAGLASKKIKRIPVSASIKGKKVNVQYKENDRSKVVNYLADHGNAITNTGYGVGTIGTGIGGFGNLNNARLQRNELRRQQQQRVSKAFDPEANRKKRSKERTPVLIGGGALTAAVAPSASKYVDNKRFNVKVANPIKSENKRIGGLRMQHEGLKRDWDIKAVELNNNRVAAQQAITGVKGSPERKALESKADAANKADMAHKQNGIQPFNLKEKAVPKFTPGKTTKVGTRVGLGAGAALAGLGVANEIHRRSKGSRSY